jgi:hypothetical protein
MSSFVSLPDVGNATKKTLSAQARFDASCRTLLVKASPRNSTLFASLKCLTAAPVAVRLGLVSILSVSYAVTATTVALKSFLNSSIEAVGSCAKANEVTNFPPKKEILARLSSVKPFPYFPPTQLNVL